MSRARVRITSGSPIPLGATHYARRLHGEPRWTSAHFGYKRDGNDDTTFDEQDSGPFMPKSVVVGRSSRWPPFLGRARKARRTIPWQETIIYEAHVKGLTVLH